MTRNDKLDQQLEEARRGILDHWRLAPVTDEDDLDEAQPASERCEPVMICVEAYFESLKASSDPVEPSEVLAAMERLFNDLDDANENAEGRLLRGGERDLLVPIVNEAAKTAGLRPGDVEGSDSTQPYHDF